MENGRTKLDKYSEIFRGNRDLESMTASLYTTTQIFSHNDYNIKRVGGE